MHIKKEKGPSRQNCWQICQMWRSTLYKAFSKDLPDMFQVNNIVANCLYLIKNQLKKKLTMKIRVVYDLHVVWILLMSSKILNNTSNKGLSNYFSKKTVNSGKGKISKYDKKNLLVNDDVIKNNVDVIILITWLMLKFLVTSENVLCQVSSNLGKVNNFYGRFYEAGQKAPPDFQKSEKACLG